MPKGCNGSDEKLTAERRAVLTKILEEIETGLQIKTACRNNKISTRTFYHSLNNFVDLNERFMNRAHNKFLRCRRGPRKLYLSKESESHKAELKERLDRLQNAGRFLSGLSIRGINGDR